MNLKKEGYKMLENLYYRINKAKFNVTPLRRESLQKELSPNFLKLCASCFNKAYPLTQTGSLNSWCTSLRKVWRSPSIKQRVNDSGDGYGFPKLIHLLESSPVK